MHGPVDVGLYPNHSWDAGAQLLEGPRLKELFNILQIMQAAAFFLRNK